MKKLKILIVVSCLTAAVSGQEWDGIKVPPSPGPGMVWELQENVSDDFNYESAPSADVDTIGGKWTNWYHNAWNGPNPTHWKRDHVWVEDGKFKVKTSRVAGDSLSILVNGKYEKRPTSYLGCATSVKRVRYPVYIETRVKIMKSVLASDVWLLSPDDTQEIDICEAYGGDRYTNSWFSNKRIHLSHHVFIRNPFQDWQPNDEGSFYTDGSTVWSDGYHRIGVYWKDPWNLEYYVDGKLVRTRSGKEQIDPKYHTNAVDPGDMSNDTRTGLSKEMDIIINTEDQTWRAAQWLTPTDEELENPEDHTFNVDWIRVYKPLEGEVGPVTGVSLDQDTVVAGVGTVLTLQAEIEPYNALNLGLDWESDNPEIATVSQDGVVSCLYPGTVQIIVTTHENQKQDSCTVIVSGEIKEASLSFINESSFLSTAYEVGGKISINCQYYAGTAQTVIDEGQGGIKFWLREIEPGWSVARDYVTTDAAAIGKSSGIARGTISLEGVPASDELPPGNFYFLYASFHNSAGTFVDKGIYPIKIVRNTTGTLHHLHGPDLQIHPNPASSFLHMSGKSLDGDYQIQLISPTGSLMQVPDTEKQSLQLRLDISHLPSGLYYIRIISKGVYCVPFVKN